MKLLGILMDFSGDISLQSVIKFSTSSPASNYSRTAESVTVSCDKTIGRELMITIFEQISFYGSKACANVQIFF
jgi:hypothetical protein